MVFKFQTANQMRLVLETIFRVLLPISEFYGLDDVVGGAVSKPREEGCAQTEFVAQFTLEQHPTNLPHNTAMKEIIRQRIGTG